MSIRNLAIKLLNDDEGINQEAYDQLWKMMVDSDDCSDIISCVEATEGRFYLPEDWVDTTRKPRYRVILEIETENGNPSKWEWSELIDESNVVLIGSINLD